MSESYYSIALVLGYVSYSLQEANVNEYNLNHVAHLFPFIFFFFQYWSSLNVAYSCFVLEQVMYDMKNSSFISASRQRLQAAIDIRN